MTAHADSSALRCAGLTAGYEGRAIIHHLNLELGPGHVLAVLGRSGAGKTTLLHALAGFIRPTSGRIWLAGELVAGDGAFVEPDKRHVGVVFQDNSLWPHLDVLNTVAYPFRRQGMARAEAAREAQKLLEPLGLSELARRRPHQLSGGEQQRVGLARALARDARLYLLDEPTAHLDLPLRQVARGLIESGRRAGRAAAVYTTHEATDALSVADIVAVLVAGRLAQVGRPEDVYERPATGSVAALTGAVSVLDVELETGNLAQIDGVRIPVDGPPEPGSRQLAVRPGWASLGGPLQGTVTAVGFHGPHTDHEVHTSAGNLVVRHDGPPRAALGEEVSWRLDRGWLLPVGS
ncbi:MAG: ABC transporter ATP-binding protein [Candidatus Dormibacteria bacterium]